jgi:signal transduction histidine kinase
MGNEQEETVIRSGFTRKLQFAFGAMLLVTLAIAWYFYDSARWFSADARRLTQASAVLSEHEAIARHTWETLQDMEEAVRLQRSPAPPGAAASNEEVRGAFARLRVLLASEQDAASATDAAAPFRELESATDDIFRSVMIIDTALRAGQDELVQEELARLDTSGAVSRFRGLMDSALSQERARTQDVGEEAVSLADYVVRLLPLLMLFLVLVAAFLAWRFSSRLSTSLGALREAARQFAGGQLQHRVPALAEAEFHSLGEAFNEMAAELEEKAGQLRESNISLEAKIEERTRALTESNEKLALVDEHRRKLLAEISHEFRTPLTVIRGESEIALRNKSADEEVFREAFRRIIDTADHATGLVEDLLFIVRADAGEPRLQLQEVDGVSQVQAVCAELNAKAAGRNQVIRFYGDDRPAPLQGDPRRLRQVFTILLDNALRYSPDGGEIEVDAGVKADRFVVTVKDRGIGLTEEDASHAFERFFRGREAQAHAGQGTGLGLPVARAIVEAHGGTVDLAPREGQGAVATVSLPSEGRLRVVA